FPRLLRTALPELTGDPAAPRLRECVLLGAGEPEGFLTGAAFEALAEGVPEDEVDREAERVRVRDVALMMYTSGTTAQPKGCPLTHEAIVRTGNAIVERYALTADDVWWDPLPMFHLCAILPLTAALLAGSRSTTMVDFAAGASLRQIAAERATFLFGTFPTLNQELLNHPDFPRTDLCSVLLINQVAPPDMQRALQRALPQAVQVSAYGCTELG